MRLLEGFKQIIVIILILCCISCGYDKIEKSKLQYPYLMNSDLIADDEGVIFIDTNYIVRKIISNSNKLKWELSLEKNTELLRIQFIDHYVFIGGNVNSSYYFWLIESKDGSVISNHNFNYTIYHAPLFFDNELFFISSGQRIIKYSPVYNSCEIVNLTGIESGVPNNLVEFNNKLYTSVNGDLVEIDINTMAVTKVIPLDIVFQGIIDHNFIVKSNIVIPNDKELIIFDLDNHIMKYRYSIADSSDNLDFFCGVTYSENGILAKSMLGFINYNNIENVDKMISLKVEEAPYLCDNSIKIIDRYILNSNYSNIELYNLETLEKLKTIKEKKTSPFVKSGNSILFINMENELCKIDLEKIK